MESYLPTMKTITVQEVIDAAERNGFKWTRRWDDRHYSKKYGEHVIESACILGQVALNLDIVGSSLAINLSQLGSIGVEGRNPVPIGTAIISYNDREAKNYKQALAFLKKALAPHAHKSISVREYMWLNTKFIRKEGAK